MAVSVVVVVTVSETKFGSKWMSMNVLKNDQQQE